MQSRILVWALVLPLGALSAQPAATRIVRAGDEVRLTLPANAHVRGTLVRVTDDTVYLALTKGRSPAIARSTIVLTEVRTPGGVGARAARGAKVGAFVGLGVGIVAALTPARCESGGRKVSCDSVLFGDLGEGLQLAALIVMPILGATAGSVLGMAVPIQVWREASLPPSAATDAAQAADSWRLPLRAPAGIDVDRLRRQGDQRTQPMLR